MSRCFLKVVVTLEKMGKASKKVAKNEINCLARPVLIKLLPR
jgi:hypothetical protein